MVWRHQRGTRGCGCVIFAPRKLLGKKDFFGIWAEEWGDQQGGHQHDDGAAPEAGSAVPFSTAHLLRAPGKAVTFLLLFHLLGRRWGRARGCRVPRVAVEPEGRSPSSGTTPWHRRHPRWWHPARGARGPAAGAWPLRKQRGRCIDKVPAVPFSGPFPALPSPEGKHSWHICHVRLNAASFRKEKKKNQIKENPVLPLLPLALSCTPAF